jgi:glycosyltransferase involved in cell wall biosynthesis
MDKVSVIIPTCNRADLLEKAVQSVLSQTYPCHEIIMIDDGSEAANRGKIVDISRRKPGIVAYHFSSNKGAAAARNFGIEKAHGDYILFLDDDDLIHPQMFESTLAVFRRNPDVDVVTCLSRAFIDQRYSNGALHKDDSDLLKTTYPLNHPDYTRLERITLSSLMHFTLIINSCLVKRDSIGNVRFPEDLKAGEDTYFWMMLASQGCHFMLNRQSLAYVRFHNRSCRLRTGYYDDTVSFFNSLLSGGILNNREDIFLAHAHLVLKLFEMRKLKTIRHLLPMLKCPDLILKYLYSYNRKSVRQTRHLYKFLEASRKSDSLRKGAKQNLRDFEYDD